MKYNSMMVTMLCVAKITTSGVLAATDPLIPENKQLDPGWVDSLTLRGHPQDAAIRASTKEGGLDYIGMPVGGIGCGQLYLSGDGQLWLWDIFKSNYTRESVKGLKLSIMTMGGHYSVPVKSEGGIYSDRNGAEVDQGFVLQVTTADGKVETRPLNRHGFSSVSFEGEYPIGRVTYEDAASPVTVELEAFSPFIPLNAKDSAIPATIMALTVENRGKEPLQFSLQGYLQNAVNPYDHDPKLGSRKNTLIQQDGLVTLLSTSIPADTAPEGQTGLEQRHGWGSMALSLLGAKEGLGGSAEAAVPAFPFKNNSTSTMALDKKLIGSLGQQFALEPGERKTITFLVSWYFPLHQERGGFLNKMTEGDTVNRHYKPWFTDAADVAAYVRRDFDRLAGGTRLWNKTWYDSTLPVWLLDRAIIPVNTLATQTFFWFDNGRPWGWEGVDSCEGTCTHVWSYAQAMSRLFPELERRLREITDYGIAFDETTGLIGYRGDHIKKVAIDGQAGTIIRTWREHTMSPNNEFLERVWPQTKKAIEFLISQDPDQDGVLEGSQAHTLDASWSGPMGWLSSVYCGALRAGEQMALVMGDDAFAYTCGRIADSGYEAIVEKVYNGEYFIHRPPNKKQINTSDGSHIDQVLGQSWAVQTGLPRVLPKEETVSALNALWKYNVSPEAEGYAVKHTAIKGHRVYAAKGEAGMLMTTWPTGKGAETAVPGMSERVEDFETWLGPGGYFDECMTGFEYQAAAHMVYEGEPGSELVKYGLAVARNIHDRYAPEKRNPFNEIECGDHYARAMAGYGVLLGTCGFEYNGPQGEIGFAPRITLENFRAPFTAAEGWGTFSQRLDKKEMDARIALKHGALEVQTVRLHPEGLEVKTVHVTLGGEPVSATVNMHKGTAVIELESPIRILEQQELRFVLAP
ncbi:GH116 family glycosyl-hydrolase [Pontiellaceae bacterium B1224]|nr:GH116 family glycosyl-hydrolase [Pontiellaceae bacterium B1224]